MGRDKKITSFHSEPTARCVVAALKCHGINPTYKAIAAAGEDYGWVNEWRASQNDHGLCVVEYSYIGQKGIRYGWERDFELAREPLNWLLSLDSRSTLHSIIHLANVCGVEYVRVATGNEQANCNYAILVTHYTNDYARTLLAFHEGSSVGAVYSSYEEAAEHLLRLPDNGDITTIVAVYPANSGRKLRDEVLYEGRKEPS